MSNRNPRKVYVSNISRDCRERDLGRLFEEVGRIGRLQFKNRFAFIEFERSRGCEDAVHKFDGMYFMGRRLRVEPYCYRGGDRKYRSDSHSNDYRLYITNLDSMTSWQDLKDFGRTAGKSVTFADVRVIRNDDYNKNKNELEGIIEYSDMRDFENALKELDGARLNGVRVKVYSKSSYDRNKFSEDEHSRSRDRSLKDGGGGGDGGGDGKSSRSRSRSRDRIRNKGRSYSRSQSRSRSRSRNRSRSRSRSRNRNKLDKNDTNRSPSRSPSRGSSKKSNGYKSQSRSPSPSHGN
eukprot:218997_1